MLGDGIGVVDATTSVGASSLLSDADITGEDRVCDLLSATYDMKKANYLVFQRYIPEYTYHE